MRQFLRAAAILLAITSTAAGVGAGPLPEPSSAIHDLLAQSAMDWNRGDLDAFMRSYERSPETVYISLRTVIHGYAAIRAHYARRASRRDGHANVLATLHSATRHRLCGRCSALASRDGERNEADRTLLARRSSLGGRLENYHRPFAVAATRAGMTVVWMTSSISCSTDRSGRSYPGSSILKGRMAAPSTSAIG